MDFIYFCKPDYPIGTKFVYSDLSFILLGEIVERITKRTLPDYLKQVFGELGMKHNQFNPSTDDFFRIAPTEFDVRTLFCYHSSPTSTHSRSGA